MSDWTRPGKDRGDQGYERTVEEGEDARIDSAKKAGIERGEESDGKGVAVDSW